MTLHIDDVFQAVREHAPVSYKELYKRLDLPADDKGLYRKMVNKCTVLEDQGYIKLKKEFCPRENPFTGFKTIVNVNE